MSLKLSTLRRCARSVAEQSFIRSRRPVWYPISPSFQASAGILRVAPSGHLSSIYSKWSSTSAAASATQLFSSDAEHGGKTDVETPFLLTACPGCGALAQTVIPGTAGYYSTKRKVVNNFAGQVSGASKKQREDHVAQQALAQIDPKLLDTLGLTLADTSVTTSLLPPEHPMCDRCHDLVHHHVGNPIAHPSVDSLADTISESPYKYNHIYHVLDAADFPFSLVPSIHRALSASAQRSKNRRSKHFKFIGGKVTEVSFVITRSDLLAPKKEQVDTLMPYLVQVLREALGTTGRNVRLGNVYCVSAKRGWWVKKLKSEIWERGGAGWMVGKVNVGKSNLFESVFPKGMAEDINFDSIRSKARIARDSQPQEGRERAMDVQVLQDIKQGQLQEQNNEESLLPPARMETPYPVMPTISSVPGTTASPIRIPFGNGKGELIDLPGLARGELESFVKPECRDSLLMKHRLTPEQIVVKPGSSLVLGGLISITPLDPDVVILAYPFVNLAPHLTNTLKAKAFLTGNDESGLRENVATISAKKSMASAGTFRLQWDVTKQRSGPLTAKAAAGLKPKVLPFVILSADILIEGLGWVELVAQVRKKKIEDVDRAAEPSVSTIASSPMSRFKKSRKTAAQMEQESKAMLPSEPTHFPEVVVLSPEGRFIAVRRPMNAWVLGGLHTRPRSSQQKGRPRKSMRSAKGGGTRRSDTKTV